jgi:acyl-[acyl-carrier-protein]-phospholipid O-acyltransferase / long-chain-fatty-acid--[acyl-carrier-protein] ligase
MNRFPEANDIQSWMKYVDTLPSLGEQWVESAKLPGNPEILSDTLGANFKAKTALAGSLLLSKRIAKHSPEQNVGLLLPTTAGSMIASMAVIMLGKTLVTLNYTAPMESILSAIEQAELKTVYTSTRFLANLKGRGVDLSSLTDKVNMIMLEDLRGDISIWEKVSTMLQCTLFSASHLRKKFCASPALDSTAVILFSSGSEGPPKGVMLSHKNIQANVKQVSKILNADSDDVIMANLPIFHSFGMTACLFLPMLERIKMICHIDPTDVVTNAKAIREHKATLLFGTSSFFRLYIKNRKVKAEDLASLKLIIAGAEKLQTEISAAFTQRFGKVICEGYGCTELSPVACVNTPFENLEQPHLNDNNKPGTVGKPVPGTQVRIADPDTLEELAQGTAGMIMVAGPQVMQGYLNNNELTNQVLVEQDGLRWYVTGDKGSLDEDNFLSIQDRYARFAKVSGEMIGLGTIEQTLRKALGDEDDREDIELMAVSIEDQKKGEIIIILSTAKLIEKDLRPKLIAGGLINLALPTAYIQVDTLPTLGSGKADFATAKEVARQAVFNKNS